MNNEPEFFVGYLPVPGGLKRAMRRVVAALAVAAVAVPVILVLGQHPFADSTFEFQQYRDFQGTLLGRPYPALLVPGFGTPWLLVAPGKHGAGPLVAGMEGREVRLKGERILRGEDRMLELLPGSVQPAQGSPVPIAEIDLGEVELTGEIVDSKCFFGVMNPGNGKVHRDCAVRCISGGIPPAFLVRDADGKAMVLLLANLKPEALEHIAEPITLRGRLSRSAGRLVLRAE